jgi:hypothetical protein
LINTPIYTHRYIVYRNRQKYEYIETETEIETEKYIAYVPININIERNVKIYSFKCAAQALHHAEKA